MTPAEAVAKLQDLKQRSPSIDPDQISKEVLVLENLKVDDLKAVQREFLGAVSGKKKGDLVTAIAKDVFSYRQSQLRAIEILGS